MTKNVRKILKELKEHIPFTGFASLIAVLVVGILFFAFGRKLGQSMIGLFEILHPAHVFASAVVTSAIFYKYKKNILYALIVGVVGAISLGSLSDIIFPYLGGIVLGMNTHFHLPLIEEPFLILGVALAASGIGIATKITKMPHFVHVFLSVFASLFYIVAFSPVFSWAYFIVGFFIVFIAVIIPCCVSDIIFPLLFVGKEK